MDTSANFLGDAVGAITDIGGLYFDGIKIVKAAVTNGIIDAGTATKDGLVSAWKWLKEKF